MELSKQMELFEDGGLKDEGGMVDEVSGNDVPTGSTREEVRDDIPAQLSEGEFVLPADVVRYHGLEKIMELRDEAKQGLAKMEAMGQMGNSEEAILPDDVPFDMDDLDIEDDEPQEMEMAEGGYVMVGGKPMPVPTVAGKPLNMQVGGFTGPTGTYQVPTNIATQPSYFANYAQSIAPFQPFTPSQTFQPRPVEAGQKQSYIPFNQLIPTVNARRETFEYRNAAGQKLFIPFINGQPIYPIPEGYRRYTEEQQTKTEQAPVTGTTTQVTGDGDDSPLVGTTIDKTGKGKTSTEESITSKTKSVLSGLQQNTPKSTLEKTFNVVGKGLMGAMVPGMGLLGGALAGGKTYFGGDQGPSTQGLAEALGSFDAAQGISYDEKGNVSVSGPMASVMGLSGALNELSKAAYGMSYAEKTAELGGVAPSFQYGYKPGQVDPTTNATYSINGQATDDQGNVAYSSFNDFSNAMSASSKSGYYGGEKQAEKDAAKGNKGAKNFLNYLNAERKSDKDKEASERGGTGDLGGVGDLGSGYGIGASTGKGSQTIGIESDVAGIGTGTGSGATAGSPSGGGVSTANDSTGVGSTGDADSPGGGPGGAATEGVGDYNTGGLAGKKKPKVKRMKQGGLASKK